MHIYILRRLLLMLPTLFGITLVVFTVMAASPGGISAQSLVEGQNLEPEAKKALEDYYNRRYGLDQPAPLQYLRWLNNVSPIGFEVGPDGSYGSFLVNKGSDLGQSFRYGRPVSDLIAERVPITILLNVVTIPLIYVIAIAIGVHAATQRGRSFDINSSLVMLALWSVPTMLAGVLMIGFFASDQHWRWFPTSGLSDRAALDMTFLPHWDSAADLGLLFLLAAGGALLFTQLSARLAQSPRGLFMGAVGAALGALMAAVQAGEGGVLTGLSLALLLGALGYAIGRAEFVGLRTALMGLVGLSIGIGLAAQWSGAGFERGFLLDRLWHLALPVICLSYGGFAFLAKLTRTSVLENLLADYARTARAKGVAEKDVLWRHVFRNSLLPLITVSAGLLPGLLGGSIIIETLFSIDGMGKLAVEAVKGRDRELVLSITLIGGVLTLVGYLIADLCYAIADPRISYD